jgi:integral membrane protein
VTITPKKLYSVVALAEMVTWTGLIIAMVARYGFGYEGGLFFVAGLSHGIIFMAYCITAIMIGINLRWGLGAITLAVLAAIPPWTTLPFDRWLLKKGKLDAPWALDAPSSSITVGGLDRFVRFWLRHPVSFFVVMVLGMAVFITGLLLIGPPSEWGA